MNKNSLLIQKFASLLILLFLAHSGFSQNALDFDGVDDYVRTPYTGITGNSSRTVEAWVKPTYKSSQAVIVDMGVMSPNGSRFTVNLLGGKLRIEVGGNGKTGAITVADGNWHHIAIVYDDSQTTNKYSMYVDGVMDGTPFDLTVATNTGIGDLLIGGRSDLNNYFIGQIDEVRVWNTVRTQAQLTADSINEYCSNQIGLVAYHKFNTGTAAGTNVNDTISTDDSGLGNNGVLKGFGLTGPTSNWVVGKIAPCNPPTCLSATGLGATNVLSTSADVYFTQNNTGATIKMEYGVSGFTLGQGIKSTPTNDTVSLTGLSAQTSYDVYIQEVCSATDSSAWAAFSFTTSCGIISTFPYTEDFDGTNWVSGTGANNTGSIIDGCWNSNPNSGTSVYKWGTRTGTTSTSGTGPNTDFSGTGNYIFTESSYGSTGDIAEITTPLLDLSSLTVPQLNFQYHMYGTSMGTLMVFAWDGTNYDTVWTLSGDQGNSWHEGIIDLSSYSSTTTHLVFHAIKGSSVSSDMAIDELIINEAPPCPKPTMIFANNITSSSFVVNFSSAGNSFPIEYGPTGFTQGTGVTDTAMATGHVISGLMSNTAYDFYIMNDCTGSGKGTSVWQGPYTVQTLCGFTNAYFTDWDMLNNNESDYCWNFISYGSASAYARAYAPTTSVALQPFSGSNYYRIYNSNSAVNFLVSPEIIDLDQNTLQVRFQGSDSYTGTVGTPQIYVGTMSSPNDTASYVALDTITTTTNVWTEYTVLLSNIPANHKHVVFRHANNANYVSLLIDDLAVEAQPSCVPPSSGVISNTTDTSSILNWTAGDGNTFEIEYGLAGFTQGTGTFISGLTSTTDTLTGLMANTCYDVYIRGNCTSNNSSWYGPVSFCTSCGISMAPYLENFDGATWFDGSAITNAIDPCWTRDPISGGSYRWDTDSNTTTSSSTGPGSDVSGTGKYVYTESSNGTTGALSRLSTPVIDFSALAAPTLSFYYHMYGATMGDLYVLISNNNADFDTLQVISGQQQSSETDPWKIQYVSLAGYETMPRTIQFMAKRGTSYTSDIAIDEVSVDEMPSCITPSNFVLDTVTAVSADFNWNSLSNGNSFKMEYGPVGFTQGTGSGTTMYPTASPATVSGLTPNTSYDIYLADMCDSTNWVGPITFTTLKTIDAELTVLLSPVQLGCGDSATAVEVRVSNLGVNAISNFSISANISGDVNATITTTFINSLAPGASADVVIDNMNAYMGGMVNIEAFTNLTGDQETNNDTMVVSGIEIISAVPLHMPVDTLCANDTTGMFVAISQTGIINNWYNNFADVTPFAMGDTIPALPNQTVYLDRSKEVDQNVIDAQNTSSQFGNMFKLYIKEDILFTGFSFEAATSGGGEPIAFYKSGNFVGHETTPADWTPIDSLTMTVVSNGWYRLNFATPVQFTAGDTVSLYLANKQGTKMRWETITTLNAVGDMYFANADFEYYAGVTGAYFGNNMTTGGPRAVSSIIHYSSNDVCGNNRIALTMGVNNDSAMASFTSTVNANGADVDFDASASTGQVFEWNFGDGNMGTGMMPMHTYAAGGNYTVTLVVTDTVCGTTDTISQTILATFSMNENMLSRSLKVYPNPNNGAFKISFDVEGIQDINLALLSTIGQVVYQENMGAVSGVFERELVLDNLAPGVYFLRVMANGKPTTIKLSIQ